MPGEGSPMIPEFVAELQRPNPRPELIAFMRENFDPDWQPVPAPEPDRSKDWPVWR